MKNVFTYGSLMFNQVWGRVVRGSYKGEQAALSGYRRLKVRDVVYPALLPSPGDDISVPGVLYRNVCEEDLQLLDNFEGDEYYVATGVVDTDREENVSAQFYVWKPELGDRIINEQWDEQEFSDKGLAKFLATYRLFP